MSEPCPDRDRASNKYYGAFHALKNIDLHREGLVRRARRAVRLRQVHFAALACRARENDLRRRPDCRRSVIGKPPRKRDVAMVFQSYALYPHMDVEHN